jgi:hypothetical protein
MPHTEGRYMQDLGFTDAFTRLTAFDFVSLGASAPTAPTRNAAGDFSWNVGASLGPITFSTNLLGDMIQRTGFGEDLQEQYGGAGIAGSAQVRTYRPDVIGAMSALQELTPRTAFKTKGIRPVSLKVVYLITGAALSAHTIRIDQTVYANNVANAITSVLAVGANGLATATQANPYVTVVNFPAAFQIYDITDLSDVWVEVSATTQSSGAYRFYGAEFTFEYNFN